MDLLGLMAPQHMFVYLLHSKGSLAKTKKIQEVGLVTSLGEGVKVSHYQTLHAQKNHTVYIILPSNCYL